jgi:hypothetical protein
MNLYKWRSEALRDWQKGYIIVMAEDVEKARKLVLANLQFVIRKNEKLQKYAANEFNNFDSKILDDIKHEPELVDVSCILIHDNSRYAED